MTVLKCKMCGGSLKASESVNVCVCEYCGTAQTLPKSRDDINANLFNRANNLRFNCDFDKALEIYEKIVQSNPDDSEAYWGIVLCKYGIDYVTDPASGRKIPTCHRTLPESVMSDMDYKSALSYAEPARRNLYIKEAEEIDRIQRRILDIARSEEPFDVFICYKQTDEYGKKTSDSVIANDIYYQLKQAGIKTFYAAITLEDKIGQEYEPYIYAALSSAKVMLVVGTKPEYFQSVWVKNEWSRFLKFIKSDRSRLLIPCYRDMDAYDLPEEFSHLQAQDMSKIGFINDVIHGIKKVVRREPEPDISYDRISAGQQGTGSASPDEQKMLQRLTIFFNSDDFTGASEYCDRLLDNAPGFAKAHYYKFLAEHFCHDLQELYSPQKVNMLADFYIKGYGYDISDDAVYLSRVHYVLKPSIKNAIAFSRGAEHEEYINVYDGMVSLIRNAIRAREQQKLAEEQRMAEEFRQRQFEEERRRRRERKKAKTKSLFKTLAVIFLLIFIFTTFISVADSGTLSEALWPFLILCIVFMIIGSKK